jgi:hypothetical protein
MGNSESLQCGCAVTNSPRSYQKGLGKGSIQALFEHKTNSLELFSEYGDEFTYMKSPLRKDKSNGKMTSDQSTSLQIHNVVEAANIRKSKLYSLNSLSDMDEESAYLGTFDADDNVPQGVSIFSFSDASTFTENDDDDTAFASESSNSSATREPREESFDEIRRTSALANVEEVLKRDMTHRRRHSTNYLEAYTTTTTTNIADTTELENFQLARPLQSSSIDGRRRRYRRYDDTTV